MGLTNFLFGSSSEVKRAQRQQLGNIQRLMQQSQDDFSRADSTGLRDMRTGYLQNLFSDSPQAMDAFSAPYIRQYEQQVLPQIAERAAAAGGLRSSGYNQSLVRSGEGFMQNLAQVREGQRGGALSSLTSDYDNAFNRMYQLSKQPLDISQYGGSGLIGGGLQALQGSAVANKLGSNLVDLGTNYLSSLLGVPGGGFVRPSSGASGSF